MQVLCQLCSVKPKTTFLTSSTWLMRTCTVIGWHVKYLVLGIFICGNFAWILLYGHLSRDAILRIRQHFNTFSIASIIMHVFFMSHDKVIKCINSKGQEISEWKFEVAVLPKIWMKKIEKFCPKYSGQNFSNFLFIFWAMGQIHIFILKFPDL